MTGVGLGGPTSFIVQIKSNLLSISAQMPYISPRVCLSRDQRTGVHLVRGDDVRVHHRPAALAGG